MHSDYWKDETSFFGSKNHIRALTAVKLIEGLEIKSIIDLGCGDQHIRKLINEKINYKPVDIHRRSNDCLVCDIDRDFPDGIWDLAITLGVTHHIKNEEQLYRRISKTSKYWITSISNTGDLLSAYNSNNKHNHSQTTIKTIRRQMKRFNLLKTVRCATGCLLCLWTTKQKNELEYARQLNKKQKELLIHYEATKQSFLAEHIKQRRELHEYIGKLHSKLTGEKSKTIKRINLTIDGKLKEQLKMVSDYIYSSGCSEYIHFSICYCYDNNNYEPNLEGNFFIDEWLELFEKLFEDRFCKLYIGLSPTYEVYTIYKMNQKSK